MSSFWGEMPMSSPRRGRAPAGRDEARHPQSSWPEGLRRRGEGDGVAELLELADESTCDAFRIVALLVVVATEVGEPLAGGQEVPDDVEQAVRHRDGSFVRPSPMGDLPVLGAEVAAVGAG